MRFVWVALAIVFTLPVQAQVWNDRDGDVPLSDGDLRTTIIGQDLIYYDNGRSSFSGDGVSYSYTYYNGGSALGVYSLRDDAMVCINFQNGWSRCDRYVRNKGELVMLTAKGERFPVQP